jgi:hypothetical protein
LNKRVIIPLLTPLGNCPTCTIALIICENSFPITSQKKGIILPQPHPGLVICFWPWTLWVNEVSPLKLA